MCVCAAVCNKNYKGGMNLRENKMENGWDGRERREGEIVHYILISKHLKYVLNAKMCTLSMCHSFNLHNQ